MSTYWLSATSGQDLCFVGDLTDLIAKALVLLQESDPGRLPALKILRVVAGSSAVPKKFLAIPQSFFENA